MAKVIEQRVHLTSLLYGDEFICFRNMHDHSCPQFWMVTFLLVLPFRLPTASICLITSIPSTAFPKTTCFPSNHSVLAVHKKNCDPFVLGPAFAMERTPAPVCFNWKFSSGNLL